MTTKDRPTKRPDAGTPPPLPAVAKTRVEASEASTVRELHDRPDAKGQTVLPSFSSASLQSVEEAAETGAQGPDPRILERGAILSDTWRIIALLAQGSNSLVYEVEHVRTGLNFALKVLQPIGQTVTDAARERFFREAAVLAQLSSANTVRVVDFGDAGDELFWIAMELLDGESLRSLLHDHRDEGNSGIPDHLAVTIADGVLCSLIEAHAIALVHRDLRPSNVFLQHVSGGESVVKLFDFGVAKDLSRPMTKPGEIFGQITHLPPEAIQGRSVDARSDVYSLGVVLYECLTGSLPFDEGSDMATAAAILGKPLPPIAARRTTPLSPALALTVERALARRPEDRWPDAVSMRDAILAAAASMEQARWKRFESTPSDEAVLTRTYVREGVVRDTPVARAAIPELAPRRKTAGYAPNHVADKPPEPVEPEPRTRKTMDPHALETAPVRPKTGAIKRGSRAHQPKPDLASELSERPTVLEDGIDIQALRAALSSEKPTLMEGAINSAELQFALDQKPTVLQDVISEADLQVNVAPKPPKLAPDTTVGPVPTDPNARPVIAPGALVQAESKLTRRHLRLHLRTTDLLPKTRHPDDND